MLYGKGWDRTQNLGIPSPALCQLRYEPGCGSNAEIGKKMRQALDHGITSYYMKVIHIIYRYIIIRTNIY
jgi:hypothetical protein